MLTLSQKVQHFKGMTFVMLYVACEVSIEDTQLTKQGTISFEGGGISFGALFNVYPPF